MEVLLDAVELGPLRFFVVVVEVEDDAIAFELEHFLDVEAVHHALQVDVQLALLALRLELPAAHQLVQIANVLPQMPLEDLFGQSCVFGRKDGLSFLVKILHLVLDPGVHALVKDAEHVILLPHVELDVFEVLLPLEQLPKLQLLQLLQLLPLHQLL